MDDCRCWRISGRVQGVFFRESTRRQARALNLDGRAVNLDDGRVEVVACGAVDALDKLEQWLHQGPPAARVDRVEAGAPPEELPDKGFRTG